MDDNIPIFLASDSNYAKLMATTMASIRQNASRHTDFYILDCGITAFNRRKIQKWSNEIGGGKCAFINVDMAKFAGFAQHGWITLATCARLILADIAPKNIKKALYIDVDAIAMGDIAQLYGQPLDGFGLGAIDMANDAYDMYRNNHQKLTFAPEHTYFNAGVLVIDLDFWRKNNMTRKFFDIQKKYGTDLAYNDQDILNKAFENSYKKLSPIYNMESISWWWQSKNPDYKLNPKNVENLIIRHFEGINKPHLTARMSQNKQPIPNFGDFWQYTPPPVYSRTGNRV